MRLYREFLQAVPAGYVSVEEVAAKYCRSRAWALQHLRYIEAVQVGYNHYYDPADFERYIRSRAWDSYLSILDSHNLKH